MIDFAKITKTLDGYDCHYFGARESYGTKLHCFGVMTGHGVHEKCYDDEGQQLFFNPNIREWGRSKSDAFQVIAPPKIVEVTRWIVYDRNDSCLDGYYCFVDVSKPVDGKFDHVEKVTARFEVPND
jgi:hypothetical protein